MILLSAFVVAFVAGFLADSLWTVYVQEIGAKRPLRAAFTSAGIAALGLAAVLVVVWHPITAVADICGGFLGTYLAVKRGHR